MEEPRKDAFRRFPLRYVGLSVEVVKATLPFPFYFALSPFAHIFRSTYITMDMMDKALPVCQVLGCPTSATTAVDVILWHSLATVSLPGAALRRQVVSIITIFDTTRLLYLSVKKNSVSALASIRLLSYRMLILPPIPQLISLICIPIIVPPIDHATDIFMDMSYRVIFGKTY